MITFINYSNADCNAETKPYDWDKFVMRLPQLTVLFH